MSKNRVNAGRRLATCLFDEPGTLEAAAGTARAWSLRCFDAARVVPRVSAVAGGAR